MIISLGIFASLNILFSMHIKRGISCIPASSTSGKVNLLSNKMWV